MRFNPRGALQTTLFVLVVSALPGCGSSTSSHDVLGQVASALMTYNSQQPRDLAGVQTACSNAAANLEGPLNSVHAGRLPPSQRKLKRDLLNALARAVEGFNLCTKGARANSYPQMVKAAAELDSANSWLRRARSHHH